MATFPTYSKIKNGLPDVFEYDKIPDKLKVQIYHIWNDFFAQDSFTDDFKRDVIQHIHDTICKETGKKILHFNNLFIDRNPASQIEKYFDSLKETDPILDVVDIMFFYIEKMQSVTLQNYPYSRIRYSAESAIEDLNTRFRENGIGYQFANSKIIRVDNQLLHQEAIKPALHLLTDPDYSNANDEYMKAHEHFRFKRNQECLNECLKSFETTMKIICTKNGWTYKNSDTAKPLINILLTKQFMPTYHESYLSSLRQLLESNIPTVRNKNSGHGQGTKKIIVPDHLASYLLNVTGSTIKLIIDTQKELEKKTSH